MAQLYRMRLPQEGPLMGIQLRAQGEGRAAQMIQRGFEGGTAGLVRGFQTLTQRREAELNRKQQESQFARSLALRYRGQSINAALGVVNMRLGQLNDINRQMELAQEGMLEAAEQELHGVNSQAYLERKDRYDQAAQQKQGTLNDLNALGSFVLQSAGINFNMATKAQTGQPAVVPDIAWPYVEGETPEERSKHILVPSSPGYGGKSDPWWRKRQPQAQSQPTTTGAQPTATTMTTAQQDKAYEALPEFLGGGLPPMRTRQLTDDLTSRMAARPTDELEMVKLHKVISAMARDTKAPKWKREWASKMQHPAEIQAKEAIELELGEVKSMQHNEILAELNEPEFAGWVGAGQFMDLVYERLAAAKTKEAAREVGSHFKSVLSSHKQQLEAAREAAADVTAGAAEFGRTMAEGARTGQIASDIAAEYGVTEQLALEALQRYTPTDKDLTSSALADARRSVEEHIEKRGDTALLKVDSDMRQIVRENAEDVRAYNDLVGYLRQGRIAEIEAALANYRSQGGRSPRLLAFYETAIQNAKAGLDVPMPTTPPVALITPEQMLLRVREEIGSHGFDFRRYEQAHLERMVASILEEYEDAREPQR